jgi:hypothetical protein
MDLFTVGGNRVLANGIEVHDHIMAWSTVHGVSRSVVVHADVVLPRPGVVRVCSMAATQNGPGLMPTSANEPAY